MFDICIIIISNHLNSLIGGIGNHCVNIFVRRLDTDMIIKYIIIFCSSNILRCFFIFICIVCYIKIGDITENNVDNKNNNDRDDDPNVNVGKDERQADCSEDDTADDDKKIVDNVDIFIFRLEMVGS